MKGKDFGTYLTLSPESIDRCSEIVTEYLGELKTEKKEIIRIRFSIEEIMYKWSEHFGIEKRVRIACYSYLGQPTIELRLSDEPYDPLAGDAAEDGLDWSKKLLSNMQTTPLYSYSKNTNVITFKLVRKRRSPIFWIVIALAAAIAASAAGFLLPDTFRTGIAENLLAPICNTYLLVLNFFGIPLIFFSVALGICGIGDVSSFGKIGKKMVRHFGLSLFVVTILAGVIAFPLFNFSFGGAGVNVDYTEFLSIILDIFPPSLVTPFIDCNAMQLIVMGIIIGIAILKLQPVATNLSKVMDDFNGVLVLISQWFTRIIPIFVFLIIVKSVWAGQLKDIIAAWKPWAITIGLEIVVVAIMAFQICVKHKVNIFVLMKKALQSFLIAIGTNSVGAVIPECYNFCASTGVDGNMMGVGIAVGTSVYKPTTAIRFLIISFALAVSYDVKVSVGWFVMAIFMAMILSIAAPAIPGGALLFFPMLFTQLGIPAEAMAAMLATDFFFDAPSTGFATVSQLFGLVQQAGGLEMLDEAQLRKAS